jgi:DNA invertase Pin-like site-specific DNA recombinase
MGYFGSMRVVAYVRELPGNQQPDTAYAQSERIRRWVRDSGNELVATCEDLAASSPSERPGFKALVDISRSGGVDAVVLADLTALASDKVDQEIILSDLRSAGVTIISTSTDDHALLQSSSDDHIRIVVRDVIAKVTDYRDSYGLASDASPRLEAVVPLSSSPARDGDPTDVVVELIAPAG